MLWNRKSVHIFKQFILKAFLRDKCRWFILFQIIIIIIIIIIAVVVWLPRIFLPFRSSLSLFSFLFHIVFTSFSMFNTYSITVLVLTDILYPVVYRNQNVLRFFTSKSLHPFNLALLDSNFKCHKHFVPQLRHR